MPPSATGEAVPPGDPPPLPSGLVDALVAHAPVGLACFDARLRCVLANPALWELTGGAGARQAVDGRDLLDLRPAVGARLLPTLQRVLASGQPVRDLEVPGAPAGRWRLSCYPVEGAAAAGRGAVAVVTPVPSPPAPLASGTPAADLTGTDYADRVIPAGRRSGTAWTDVSRRGRGRIGLVVGEVDGPEDAAGVAGSLRDAVRAYALLDLSPAKTGSCLGELLGGLPPPVRGSWLAAVLDPGSGELRYAGYHSPPPVLCFPDGRVEPVAVGAPDGGWAVEDEPVERRARVPAGATLVLHTPGIDPHPHDATHPPTTPDPAGASGAGAAAPAAVLERLAVLAGPAARAGTGVALLAIRPGIGAARPVGSIAELSLPGDLAVVRVARNFAADTLQRWELGALAETVVLLVSEVVTNALRHARSGAELRMHRTVGGVEVEVLDGNDRMPVARPVEVDSESGRGLHLIEALASSWGTEPVPTGKRVWFRVQDGPDSAAS